MGWWTDHAVPRIADKSLSVSELEPRRAAVCQGLHGRVLEVGFGSGLNVDHYPDAVTSVDAVEPSDVGWRLASKRLASARVPVHRTVPDAQRLGAFDDSYDAALSTFTFCTIPDLGRALAEIRRVLRPGGTLHFLEHGLAKDPRVSRWQHRLNPVQRTLGGGCHLDRAITDEISRAGFDVESAETGYLPGPRVSRPWSYLYSGVARAG